MFEVLDVVWVILTADEVINSFALFMDGEGGFVELIDGIVLFVVDNCMEDTFICQFIQALLLVTFKKLFFRSCKINFTLEIIFILVLLRDRFLYLGVVVGQS